MNFTNPSDFKFVTGADLEDIELDNDIMPVRSDKSLLRGIDIAFLYEAVEERCRACNVEGQTMEFSKNISKDQINTIINRWNKLYELKDEFDIDGRCGRWLDCELDEIQSKMFKSSEYATYIKPHLFKPSHIPTLTTDDKSLMRDKILEIYAEIGRMHVKFLNGWDSVRRNTTARKENLVGTVDYERNILNSSDVLFTSSNKGNPIILEKGYGIITSRVEKYTHTLDQYINRDIGLMFQDATYTSERMDAYRRYPVDRDTWYSLIPSTIDKDDTTMTLTVDSSALVQNVESIITKYDGSYYQDTTLEQFNGYKTILTGTPEEHNAYNYIGLSDRTMWNI